MRAKEILSVLWNAFLQVWDIITKLVVWVFFYFEDIQLLANAMIVLICIDWFLGVWRVIKLKEFNWNQFKQGYTKIIIYVVALMAMFIFESVMLLNKTLPFTTLLAATIGVEEVISIFRNGREILGGKQKHLQKFINKFTNIVKDEAINHKSIKRNK